MTPLAVAVSGALAGIAGALLLTPLVRFSRWSLGAGGGDHGGRRPPNPLAPGPILSESARIPPDLLQMTGVFVQKVATGLFGMSLSVADQRRLGLAWHVAYGGVWGMGYGLLQSSVPVPAAVLGPAFGVAVWAMGPAWLVPRMRLMLPVGRASRIVTTLVIAWHVLFGAVLAIVFSLLTA